jgi:hypothetical protein
MYQVMAGNGCYFVTKIVDGQTTYVSTPYAAKFEAIRDCEALNEGYVIDREPNSALEY